jgi:glycolate oxidase iron-sulfur subunit
MRRPAALAAPMPAQANMPVAGVHAGLFVGCVARALEPAALAAALEVLRYIGISVDVPRDQVCCGAMHRHNGEPDAAEALLARNRDAFANRNAVGCASACVAELQPAMPAVEICRFLLDAPWPDGARPAPLAAVVAVHEPCSHRNVLRDSAAIYDLLAKIPTLEVVPLPGNEQCCGAAGTYLLRYPETALRLAADKVAALERLKPRYLVTTNTGCAAHLAARVRAAGLAVEVLHPVELLARQLHCVVDRGSGGTMPSPTETES